jgi:uncharacterized protein
MSISTKKLQQSIARICQKEPVALVYLYGSHALGKADDDSDIDIGILADAHLSKEQLHTLRFHLMKELSATLCVSLEKVDLVLLQQVPILLQYNVIRNGILLLQCNRETRIHYELGVEQAYDDERPYLERETEYILHSILSHSI